jgi:photosystem II stability/assembly factor-like uncharacterized protein
MACDFTVAGVATSRDGRKVYAKQRDNIWVSNDYGVSFSNMYQYSYSVHCVETSADGQRALIIAFDWVRTTDGGATWTVKGGASVNWSPETCQLSSDGTKVLATKVNGDFYYSSDFGDNVAPRTTGRQFRQFRASSDLSKVVAVEDGFLWSSTDTALTWTRRTTSQQRFIAISASATANLVVVTTFSGFLYVSTDYGVTWAPRDAARFWGPVFVAPSGLYALAMSRTQAYETGTRPG